VLRILNKNCIKLFGQHFRERTMVSPSAQVRGNK